MDTYFALAHQYVAVAPVVGIQLGYRPRPPVDRSSFMPEPYHSPAPLREMRLFLHAACRVSSRRVLKRLGRQAAGRGQSDLLTADDVAAIFATASILRRTGLGGIRRGHRRAGRDC